MRALFLKLLIVTAATIVSSYALAGEIRVAVASNFSNAMVAIADQFETETGHTVKLSFGSTGKHYAQIVNGAPFDAFFAADVKRPELLEKEGLGMAGSRFTYAVGKLILWSPEPDLVDPHADILKQGTFRHLAIANPKLAPYGVAARQVLQSLELWQDMQGRLVRGENIGQAFQFVASGNAELGFVARSQLKYPGQEATGSAWEVPQSLYDPIEQQAVLLNDKQAARAFMSFVHSDSAIRIIRAHGYEIP